MLPPPQEATQHSPRGGEDPHFWLTLCGSAVRDGYPPDARRLDGGEEGLTVGRAHQKELHREAFDEELQQYLSRDHFRIDLGLDGLCKLVAISNNPIWRNRCGKRTEAVVGDPPLTLVNGDAIQLFTGADDCTATGPGNLGSLLWLFQDTTSNRGPAEQEGPALESQAAGGRSQDPRGPDSGGPRTMALGTDVAKSVAKIEAMSKNGQQSGAGQSWAESPSAKAPGGGRVVTNLALLSSPRSPASGDQPAGAQPGPLRAPVRGLLNDLEDDDDGGGSEHRRRARDDDLDFRDVNDAFTASGFRF